ncbi:ATP-binding protein [Streptomyces sp. TLI_053]|uniref:ATP-binding protein n=1 Tax=Streptomyces sp. TLI_053 TaxID=1855352 RepID=UPI000B865D6B|nr:ATP-binding protein [Streptomyces sp. TLI_053]
MSPSTLLPADQNDRRRRRPPAADGTSSGVSEFSAPATVCLPYRPESVAVARRFVCAKLREWGLDVLTDEASLVVSELATNSVRTGCQARMMVAVRRPTDRIVRILVSDGSRVLPVMVDAGDQATSGRGLAMVHSLTHGRWGAKRLPFGKIIHADLAIAR